MVTLCSYPPWRRPRAGGLRQGDLRGGDDVGGIGRRIDARVDLEMDVRPATRVAGREDARERRDAIGTGRLDAAQVVLVLRALAVHRVAALAVALPEVDRGTAERRAVIAGVDDLQPDVRALPATLRALPMLARMSRERAASSDVGPFGHRRCTGPPSPPGSSTNRPRTSPSAPWRADSPDPRVAADARDIPASRPRSRAPEDPAALIVVRRRPACQDRSRVGRVRPSRRAAGIRPRGCDWSSRSSNRGGWRLHGRGGRA